MVKHQGKYPFIKISFLAISIALLLVGYLLAGVWQILLIFPAALLLWVICKFQHTVCDPSILFGAYTILAALGIWKGYGAYLMVYGFIMALASWELYLFYRGLTDHPQPPGNMLLEKNHLRSLSIMLILSFLLTTIGLSVHLNLRFGILFVLVLVVGLVVERVHSYLIRETP